MSRSRGSSRRPGRLRAALAEIRRVSARRRISWRERANDRAAVLSLLLALPLSLLLVAAVGERQSEVLLAGWIDLPPPPTGPIAAASPPPLVPEVRFARELEADPLSPWGGWAASPGTRPLGEFRVVREIERSGWPFACRSEWRPPRIEVLAHAFAGEWEVRLEAIATAAAAERLEAEAGGESIRWSPLVLLANALVAAPLLMAAGHAAIGAFAAGKWAAAAAAARRRERRRRGGFCPRCGHDTRANLWSAQCPECGDLLS
jgi:hypothetical protein